MSSTTTSLLNHNFGGIRRKDSCFSEDKITCSDCQNVELFYTKLNSGVGIRTSSGNTSVSTYSQDIALDVYEYADDTFTVIASNGVIADEVLSFSITITLESIENADDIDVIIPGSTDDDTDEEDDDEDDTETTTTTEYTTEYTDFARSEDNDITVDDVTYYAWTDGSTVYYTISEENETEEVSLFPSDEEIIEIFETTQDAVTYMLAYTENDTEGKLYNIDIKLHTADVLIEGLTVTGQACGTDFAQGWLDMFVFSNGVEVKYIYTSTEDHDPLIVEDDDNISLTDQDGRSVYGLGLVVFDSRLWIFNDKVLWYSSQSDCRDFEYNDTDTITSAGYIEFVKNITAVYPYLGSLAVFFKDSSVLITTDDDTIFAQSDESPGGCANYRSLVFHGTDLYFYDDVKKGVFSFQQVVNGDKTLGDNNALDIQEELMDINSVDIDKIKALSVVTEDRNEVWFLLPISDDEDYSIVMIYDYLRGEWVKRKCPHINTMNTIDGVLYSAGKEIYEEYEGDTFNGEFIEAYYTCTMFNLGADNTMKITKFPPRITVDGNELNQFWVKYVKNYNYIKTPKTKLLKSKSVSNILYYDSDMTYDTKYLYEFDKINTIIKMPSSTFKSLEITFYTEEENQAFAIKNIEFSKLKVKQV